MAGDSGVTAVQPADVPVRDHDLLHRSRLAIAPRAKLQRDAVAAIRAAPGGWVRYDYQSYDLTTGIADRTAKAVGTRLAALLVGIDFFTGCVIMST